MIEWYVNNESAVEFPPFKVELMCNQGIKCISLCVYITLEGVVKVCGAGREMFMWPRIISKENVVKTSGLWLLLFILFLTLYLHFVSQTVR